MMSKNKNRFQDFFENEKYVSLKNHLYNYLLRRRAVEKAMQNEPKELVLEIGSGISPSSRPGIASFIPMCPLRLLKC
jgi:hypothetical protein